MPRTYNLHVDTAKVGADYLELRRRAGAEPHEWALDATHRPAPRAAFPNPDNAPY